MPVAVQVPHWADASATSCLIIRDAAAAQDVRIEAHGAHAVRVRAVPAGAAFRDGDDIVSALVVSNSSGTDTAACGTVQLSATSAPASVTSGNLQAAVGSDGRLVFTRVSDGLLLLCA